MTQKNHFQINRRLLDHPLWISEPFTKGQAWVDLIGSANYKDGYFIKKGQRVDVKRGQTATSMLTFSKRWRWSRGKVKRFFSWLERERMIDQQAGHLTTLTTICNYNLYQLDPDSDGTSNGTTDGHQTGQQTDIKRTSDGTHPIRINKNNKNNKNKKELKTGPPNPLLDSDAQKAFLDCKKYLGMSDEEIQDIFPTCHDHKKFREAIRFAIEKNQERLLDNPSGFIIHAYKNGKTSKATRQAVADKNLDADMPEHIRIGIEQCEETERNQRSESYVAGDPCPEDEIPF